jgi:hypothetical protein
MSFQRGIDGHQGVPGLPQAHIAEVGEFRRRAIAGRLATGTLACPACDAPVAPAGRLSPAGALGCPFCGHEAAVRDFLSLSGPTRPARVAVRVVDPGA